MMQTGIRYAVDSGNACPDGIRSVTLDVDVTKLAFDREMTQDETKSLLCQHIATVNETNTCIVGYFVIVVCVDG
jgi:hypothetical protein